MRFVENGRIFRDVGRLAFGQGKRVVAAREVRILRLGQAGTQRQRKIGKVDYLVAELDADGTPIRFAALEVQAVYISGYSIKPAFRHFMAQGSLPPGSGSRLDWRSSGPKRLMPQLALKVPVFRRWGSKFFVAVDSCFFAALPRMKHGDTFANSEITWLIYPFVRDQNSYRIGDPEIVFTMWDDVVTALREGIAPSPDEILAEIARKKTTQRLTVYDT